jgi:hypothetical protein
LVELNISFLPGEGERIEKAKGFRESC